jgi:photosystem II reaction center protein PsbP
MPAHRLLALFGAAGLGVALAACGGGSSTSSAPPPPEVRSPTGTASARSGTATTGGAEAGAVSGLQAEAASAATGDIPDNQVFLAYSNPNSGYSLKYPEGWAQSGGGRKVVFRDKSNIVRVVVVHGARPTAAGIRGQLSRLAGLHLVSGPEPVTIGAVRGFKVVYSTQSAPNPVTGKRVTLVVDRFYIPGAAKEAVVDLGTPEGVDNVDAFRLMSESFRWK